MDEVVNHRIRPVSAALAKASGRKGSSPRFAAALTEIRRADKAAPRLAKICGSSSVERKSAGWGNDGLIAASQKNKTAVRQPILPCSPHKTF